MKVIYSPVHKIHDPRFEIFNGRRVPHAEKPERIEQIIKALRRIKGVEVISPKNFSLTEIARVHTRDYINFLKETCEGLKEGEIVYPAVFGSSMTDNKIAQRGRYAFDMYTPIMRGTFTAAKTAAFCALTGVELLLQGEKEVYGLCRPPGHHAETSRMGGYCYFNNAAIAAGYLNSRGAKVAILDLDFHHGNGTQQIFYNSDQVLYVSIHASPNRMFPCFWGFKTEEGEGKGKGFNFNFPLEKEINGDQYLAVLKKAGKIIKEYDPDFLIISLGFDTSKNDPLGDFRLDLSDYEKIGKEIKELGYPTLFIQEGGYNLDQLGNCAYHFFHSFLS